MPETLDTLLEKLWQDYAAMNRQAHTIHRALESRGEKVVNDHVAFRTFDLAGMNIDALAAPFVKLGYKPHNETYQFEQKRLVAKHYEHADPRRPKIFISALMVDALSKKTRDILQDLVRQIPPTFSRSADFLVAGAPWKNITHQTYQDLRTESEYAAWMSAFGFRVNHFTVFANALKSFKGLGDLNAFIKKLGFDLNSSGGQIKGSKDVYLEQSSTLAYPVDVEFSDKRAIIPGCYYEFARRYPLPDGTLFQGFIPDSADKIFESTDVGKKPRNQKDRN